MSKESGQLLLEIFIAVAVVVVVSALGAQLVLVGERSVEMTGDEDTALKLTEETFEAVRSITTENWQAVYGVSKGAGNLYHPEQESGKWVLVSGSQVITINGVNYTRSFYIDNVNRDISKNIVLTGGTEDPGTQKITVAVSWPNADVMTNNEYITRWRGKGCVQTDWSGGGGGSEETCPTNKYSADNGHINATSELKLQ